MATGLKRFHYSPFQNRSFTCLTETGKKEQFCAVFVSDSFKLSTFSYSLILKVDVIDSYRFCVDNGSRDNLALTPARPATRCS